MKPYQHRGNGYVTQWYDGWICADWDFNCQWIADERHKDKKISNCPDVPGTHGQLPEE
jgi:hypothetical protein